MAQKTAQVSRKGNTNARVYQALLKKVISLELKPGEYLDEKKLMEELKVGRTPLREGIMRLKVERLIEGEPNRTSYVKDISLKGTLDLIETLIIIERSVTFLAAQRIAEAQLQALSDTYARMDEAIKARNTWDINQINEEFHSVIAQASGNECLYQIHHNIRNQVLRLSHLVMSFEIHHPTALAVHCERIQQHHRAFVRCLQQRELTEIEKLCTDHIELLKQRMFNCTADTRYF